MRTAILTIAAAVSLTLGTGLALATPNLPMDAKQVKGEFVKSHNQCLAPNTTSSNGYPACAPAVPGDAQCDFSSVGKGKFKLKSNTNGPDKAPGTSDDGDLDVQVLVVGLTNCPTGSLIYLAASMRITDDDCGGQACTTMDLPDFFIAPCSVDAAGHCKLKTTLNSWVPGTLLGGKHTNVELRDVSMFHNSQRVMRGGILLP